MSGQNPMRSFHPGPVFRPIVLAGAMLLATGCSLIGPSGPPGPGTYLVKAPVVGTMPGSGVSGIGFQLQKIVVRPRYAIFYGAVINESGPLTMVSGFDAGNAYYRSPHGKQVGPLQTPNQDAAVSQTFGRGSGSLQTPSTWHKGAAILGWMRFPAPPGRTITFDYPPFRPITIQFAG